MGGWGSAGTQDEAHRVKGQRGLLIEQGDSMCPGRVWGVGQGVWQDCRVRAGEEPEGRL